MKSETKSYLKSVFGKELFVLWFALTALICAAMSLNSSLNKLADKKQG